MKEFWNERYAEKEYAYGIEPNLFFKAQLDLIPKGKILFLAEGEGRNAVYAASEGFEVHAFDISQEGKNKALQMAQQKNVTINYLVSSVENLQFPSAFFDVIVFVFAHFPIDFRKSYFQNLLSLLKPNGVVVFEGFSKEQIHFNSGGPKQIEMLFSEEEVKDEFPNLDFQYMETVEINLNEGKFHQGKGSVVRFIGIKK